jgi:hypothetical protein
MVRLNDLRADYSWAKQVHQPLVIPGSLAEPVIGPAKTPDPLARAPE